MESLKEIHDPALSAKYVQCSIDLMKRRLAYIKGVEDSTNVDDIIRRTRQKILEQLEEFSYLQERKNFAKLVSIILRKLQLKENRRIGKSLPINRKIIQKLLVIDKSRSKLFFVLKFLEIFHIEREKIEKLLIHNK